MQNQISVPKWELKHNILAAAGRLRLKPTHISFIEGLFRLHKGDQIAAGTIIYHSNKALIEVMSGLSEGTLVRVVNELIERGLMQRKSSSNGKRFARKDHTGKVINAYGLDLTPLVLRFGEIRDIANAEHDRKARIQSLKDQILAALREIRKKDPQMARDLIARAGLATSVAGSTNVRFRKFELNIPSLEAILAVFCNETKDQHSHRIAQEMSSCDPQNETHIDHKNPEEMKTPAEMPAKSIKRVKPFRTEQRRRETHPKPRPVKRSFSFDMLKEACPSLDDFGVSPQSTEDLEALPWTLARIIGVSTESINRCHQQMGGIHTGVLLAGMLEFGTDIANPTGYLERLMQNHGSGKFNAIDWVTSKIKQRAHQRAPHPSFAERPVFFAEHPC